ncbi:MAG: bifunctional diaminohydroxyphosphoribosylaminopyrimidine deaminase/5-amino-6-(5-phosphoribosylamino)uracil reductase RibD [Pseudomonadota bacterium]
MSLDQRYMKMALSLGRRGLGSVWPNPAVGCVIVKEGRVVGRGTTRPGGRPHAETVALAQAGGAARGATAYVTLEPCSHHGQTPPCAEALIKAGVARVVSPLQDSDPRVSGKGFAMLKAAGIAVDTGVCAAEAARDHAGFFLKTEQQRPWLTLKLALTLDGRIATRTGDSQWITGAQARRRVHALRARHDAVLVGSGTARADDPSLTVRGLGVIRQPVRVVATSDLAIPQDGTLVRSARDTPVWLCHGPEADTGRWAQLPVKLLACDGAEHGIAPASMMRALAGEGITRVFCEGGGSLAASLLQADLVDQIIIHSAGVLVGADGIAGLAGMGADVLAELPRWRRLSHQPLGADIETVWERGPSL